MLFCYVLTFYRNPTINKLVNLYLFDSNIIYFETLLIFIKIRLILLNQRIVKNCLIILQDLQRITQFKS